jgi:hypothetical protein
MSTNTNSLKTQAPVSYWKLRGLLIVASLVIFIVSYQVGYNANLSPSEANSLIQDNTSYVSTLKGLPSLDFKLLRIFLDEYSVVLACNTPFLGPALSIYLAYASGTLDKAYMISGNVSSLQVDIPPYVNYIESFTLILATAEGLLLSYIYARKKKINYSETISILLLQASLIFLVASIVATLI